MQRSAVVLSVCGLMLPGISIVQAGDIPTIGFSRSDIHPNLTRSPEAVPAVLRPSPEFVIRMPDGKQLLLSSFRGQVVALRFVHTTCPICQEASRVFTKLFRRVWRAVPTVDVAFNSMADLYVPEFAENFAISYPVGSNVGGSDGIPRVAAHQRFTIPQIVWIDLKGNIRARTPRNGDPMLTEGYWRNMLEMLLNKPGQNQQR